MQQGFQSEPSSSTRTFSADAVFGVDADGTADSFPKAAKLFLSLGVYATGAGNVQPKEDKMNRGKWLLLAALAGLLAAAPTAFAGDPYESSLGIRADIHRDRIHHLQTRRQIYRDHLGLRSDRRQFGPHSRQVRADRHLLRHDQRRFVRQARDIHRDRKQLLHRRSF
jgi:hypothetical protein